MRKLYYFFTRMTTRTLILIPYFFSIMCLGLGGLIGRYSPFLHFILFPLAFFFFGLAGIPMIVRKEALLDRDHSAAFFGIIHLVVGWGLAFIPPIYNAFIR
jgi:hypothetical protein